MNLRIILSDAVVVVVVVVVGDDDISDKTDKLLMLRQ